MTHRQKTYLRPERTRRRAGPVTVTRLPAIGCPECERHLPHQPGAADRALADHRDEAHAASPQAGT